MSQIQINTGHVKLMTSLVGAVKRLIEQEPQFKANQNVCSKITQVFIWKNMNAASRLPNQYASFVELVDDELIPQGLFNDAKEALKTMVIEESIAGTNNLSASAYIYLVLRHVIEQTYPNSPIIEPTGLF